MAFKQRMNNEIREINKEHTRVKHMYSLTPTDNLYQWNAKIYGPIDSVYSGFSFNLHVSLPLNYPFVAPTVKFTTPIKHVNINENGDICLDILKDKWSANNTMLSVMMSIYCLLLNPNFDDAFNDELLQIYKDDKKMYKTIVLNHCKQYAT